MSGWQPIETAPKDEDGRVLIFDPDRGVEIVTWVDWAGPDGKGEWRETHELYGSYEPTHWMPLPEAPK